MKLSSFLEAAGRTVVLCAAFLLAGPMSAETLHYSINWQSGLSLGEATLTSTRTGDAASGEQGWSFSVDVDASIPGFLIRDDYRAEAGPGLCSIELNKELSRGARKTRERVSFDQDARRITRETLDGGGKSDYSAPECARDALSFLQFVRNELAQGRVAPQQPAILGAKYDVQLTYTGSEKIRVGDEWKEADRVRTSIHGPQADYSVDLYFARDPERTPLAAKLPLALGTFTVELLP